MSISWLIVRSNAVHRCHTQVGNKTLKAHRCILGQHSEVFRSMFAQESMLEAQKGIIDIQDSRFEPVGYHFYLFKELFSVFCSSNSVFYFQF